MRDFQKGARDSLKIGRSVVIVAPTGLGKTRAALSPFVDSIQKGGHLGSRLIYSLPMRALAQSTLCELEVCLKDAGFIQKNGTWTKDGSSIRPVIHHGEEPESQLFSERACITTMDQTFTAFAGAPLSFAASTGHAIAGALLTSYTVFDETHLLSPRYGLPLLFALLKLRERWGLLSTVMTATLPNVLVKFLCSTCNMERVVASADDVEQRDGWRKIRLDYESNGVDIGELADRVVSLRQDYQNRTIVFVNTVDRAIQLYRELKHDVGKDQVIIAHSRFAPKDRKQIEEELLKKFGKDSDFDGILVTTQVAEAGLNISANLVVSELAPIDSLIQRVGRCARFKPTSGNLNGYVLVTKPKVEGSQKWYAPYDPEPSERTERELQKRKFPLCLDWKEENVLIDAILGPLYDQYLRGSRVVEEAIEEEAYPLAQRGRKQSTPHPPLTVSQAIGVYERAFHRREPREIETLLREMVNVNLAAASNRIEYKQNLCLRRHPITITVPIAVFLSKVKERGLWGRFCIINPKAISDGRPILKECDSVSEILPGRTYLIDADVAGYREDEGLTFEGAGIETGFEDLPKHEKYEKATSGRDQTIQEHLTGVWNRSERISRIYSPFVERWCSKILNLKDDEMNVAANTLLAAMRIALMFHDVGKFNVNWQRAIGWTEGMEFIARTKDKKKGVPFHAKYAYPFLRLLLRKACGDYRFLDHFALASAKHHSLEVTGNVEAGEFQPPDGSEQLLKKLAVIADPTLEDLIPDALASISDGSKMDEPPSPSDDFYFLYCLSARMVKICDWEDAGNQTIELEGL